MGKLFWQVGKLFWQGRWENYFGRWGNTKENRREILFTDSQIRSLDADWSYPDDPARVLAAVGRLNPSAIKLYKKEFSGQNHFPSLFKVVQEVVLQIFML